MVLRAVDIGAAAEPPGLVSLAREMVKEALEGIFLAFDFLGSGLYVPWEFRPRSPVGAFVTEAHHETDLH